MEAVTLIVGPQIRAVRPEAPPQISFSAQALATPCSGNPPGAYKQYPWKALSLLVDFMLVMDYYAAGEPSVPGFTRAVMSLPLVEVRPTLA